MAYTKVSKNDLIYTELRIIIIYIYIYIYIYILRQATRAVLTAACSREDKLQWISACAEFLGKSARFCL